MEYTPYWIYVNEIEFAKDATILRCELRHRPHWWVKIDGAEYLKDRDSDRVWKFLKVEGVELGKETWMPDEGHVPCTLYFEPVPADVKEVNLTESDFMPAVSYTYVTRNILLGKRQRNGWRKTALSASISTSLPTNGTS